ncbi:MAG: hypothetical protein ACYCZD_01490 [Rhodanobacter sp.]
MVTWTALAGNGQPTQPVVGLVRAQASLLQIRQQVCRHRTEVRQLERAVATQTSRSRQASERLQQQDQAIAELHKQLQALHARSTAGIAE